MNLCVKLDNYQETFLKFCLTLSFVYDCKIIIYALIIIYEEGKFTFYHSRKW